MSTRSSIVALVLFTLTIPAAWADADGLRAEQLRCEYRVDPLAVEEPHPRLSWIVASERRGERQTAYRILVASTAERLLKDEGDLWDSGKVASSATTHVSYDGKPLGSRAAAYWKVRAWNKDGVEGPWSAPARWEMGLLKAEDWAAKWVDASPVPTTLKVTEATYYTPDGKVKKDVTEAVARLLAEKGPEFPVTNENLGGDPAKDVAKRLHVKFTCDGVPLEVDCAEKANVYLPAGRTPYLRKSFDLAKPVARVRIFATALGVYELRLNGKRVGDAYLAPGWTDYPKRVRYQAYDVTKQVTQGENVLGAIVAPGWFAGHVGLFNAFQFYGKPPALRAQLEITFTDGTSTRVVTDETWKSHASPLLMADLLKGETYDAALEMPGWDAPGFDAAAWTPVKARDDSWNLQADVDEPVRVFTELPARTLTEPAPGRWTYDLGQNLVGVVRLRVAAPKGTVVTIRHAEVLNADGTIYTANLRGATSTDTYVCKGDGVETWQPGFTFHGFRYVELTGLPRKPALDAVTGVAMGSDLPLVGEFGCSDPRLNQLQSNIYWGLRGNYLSIPTDCPQRDERMGWMGDAQVFTPTATFNCDVAAFMTKWMVDVVDAQREDGAFADVSPVMRGLNFGTPAWGDAGVIVPWTVYEAYGDKRMLERCAASMIKWVEWCKANSTDLIREKNRGNDYGDWLSIKADTSKELIGTAYFAHSTDLLARSLRVLGRDAEAEKYEKLFADIKAAFIRRYLEPDGRIKNATQSSYILALRFNLLPDELRAKAIEELVADIEARDWHVSTGFVGVSHILHVLEAGGRTDVAHRLLMQDTFPSWLFSVKHGATTIWERWDGWTPATGPHPDFGMNSFNHYALGSCGQWMFERVAGIAREPGVAGFEKIVVHPRPGALTSAKATLRSIRGPISTAWTVKDGAFSLDVTIPANTTATVVLPTKDKASVRESGGPAEAAQGVKFVRVEGEESVWSVGSGRYRFECKSAK